MVLNVSHIKACILKIPFVKQLYTIEHGEYYIQGKVEIAFDGLADSLDFEFEIAPQYPLKTYDSESITFRNKELLQYSHVMRAGHICIHTSHSTNVEEKLIIDFNSLKNWIVRYYINKSLDLNYEHIIVNESSISDQYYAYYFTDCESTFIKGEFGEVKLSFLNYGLYKKKRILNFITQGFTSQDKNDKNCQWSNIYRNQKINNKGFYYFIEESPSVYNKFVITNWTELVSLLSPAFLNLLHKFEKENLRKSKGDILPFFLGYKISQNEIHWQVAMLEIGSFPLVGVPEKIDSMKTGRWHTKLTDQKIQWSLSRNTSYKYFFGRGTFGEQITNKKILLIGVGAVGSIIAKTFTRGGCKFIDFVDYDVKEPENVCRSEYMFANGIMNKTEELASILSEISPFVNINRLENNYFEGLIKRFYSDKTSKDNIVNQLNNYDLIIDCSTDNDLMYVLNTLELDAEMINVSITNHAKELVCAFHPNIYKFVNNQFSNVLKNDVEDLYNPTGCWNPTFKASYNDINTLIQLALKHINIVFINGSQKNNFVIQEDMENSGSLKIVEF